MCVKKLIRKSVESSNVLMMLRYLTIKNDDRMQEICHNLYMHIQTDDNLVNVSMYSLNLKNVVVHKMAFSNRSRQMQALLTTISNRDREISVSR